MTDEYQRTRRILQRLADVTTEESVPWQQTGVAEYTLQIGPNLAVISSDDHDDLAPYTFQIRRDANYVIGRVRSMASDELANAPQDEVAEADADNRALAALYGAARDQALGISATLDAIERQLGLQDPE